jgi:serine/threonine protein phosphatase 1
MWTSIVRSSTMASSPMAASNAALQWEFVEPEKMRPHFSGKTVIVGQTRQTSDEVLDLGFLKLIDTDCSRGGWLTAIDLINHGTVQASETDRDRDS